MQGVIDSNVTNRLIIMKTTTNTNKRSFLKRTYYLLSIFIIGTLHFFIARQAIKPTKRRLNLALVRNEYLDKPPSKIIVVGEAVNSIEDGAYVLGVLRNAFGKGSTTLHPHIYRHDLLDADELRDIASRTDVLWVMAVSSPCSWADAAIAIQKKSCEEGDLPTEQCTVHEFAKVADYYRIPWYDESPPDSEGTDESQDDNKDTIIESIPAQDEQYNDIFDMRQQKLLLLKQIMDAVPRHVKILRLNFELNPDVFINDLVKEYQFKLRKKYKPQPPRVDPELKIQRVNANSQNDDRFACIEYIKWIEAQQRIDWTLEGYFGHNSLDCRLCREDAGQASYFATGQAITTPSTIYVLGERNSGTTFVSNTLAKAFDPPNTMGSDLEKFSSDIPVLLHKHMFRHDLLDKKELDEIRKRDDILWIMVVRSPCDW